MKLPLAWIIGSWFRHPAADLEKHSDRGFCA